MKRFELHEVIAIPRAVGQTLEAHNAAEISDACRLTVDINVHGALGDRIVIERWQPSTHDVDDAVATIDAQVVRPAYLLAAESLAVIKTNSIHTIKELLDRGVSCRPVGHEQITVLG